MSALGNIVSQLGEAIALELGSQRMSIERQRTTVAGNSTDIREVSRLLGILGDEQRETNKLLRAIVKSMPEDKRPTLQMQAVKEPKRG